MNIGELDAPKKKQKKRVGRGHGSGSGKTAGRGHKGQKSRSGWKTRAWFEGGQMPLQRRVPKRGFKSFKDNSFQLVNIVDLHRFDEGATVDANTLKEKGLIRNIKKPIKILGVGELDRKLVVYADAFSISAREKITNAGGETHPRSAMNPASDS